VSGRDFDQIAYELDLIECLDDAGIPVAKPIHTHHGERILTLAAPEGERHAVLFTYAAGDHLTPPKQTPDIAYLYGRAVAKLHRAADEFQSPHAPRPLDRVTLIERPLAAVRPFLAQRPDALQEVQSVAEELAERIDRLVAGGGDVGPCHGDAQGGNATLTAEGSVTFFDFEYCGPGPRAYDIAVFCWGAALGVSRLGWSQATVERLWEAYLRGYEAVRPLSPIDRAAILPLVAARELWYLGMQAGSWAHYGLTIDLDAFFDRELRFLREWRAGHE
jgi:Ser/Thr protein kinase RdoA (MazF antagonist)